MYLWQRNMISTCRAKIYDCGHSHVFGKYGTFRQDWIIAWAKGTPALGVSIIYYFSTLYNYYMFTIWPYYVGTTVYSSSMWDLYTTVARHCLEIIFRRLVALLLSHVISVLCSIFLLPKTTLTGFSINLHTP